MTRHTASRTRITLALCAISAILLTFTACGSSTSEPPASSARSVRFEITGTYTRPLTVVHTSESGSSNTVVEVASLPWSRDITYAASAGGIGITAQSVASNPGVAGQTVTVRVLSAGRQVQTNSGTANSSGIVSVPTQAYVFP